MKQKTRLRFARYLIYVAVVVGMGLAGFCEYDAQHVSITALLKAWLDGPIK